MAIFLTADSKVIVQGITGSEGTKHTRRMVASGTNVVGGVNPKKAGSDVDGIPVFATVAEAMEKTGADVSVLFVPPAFAKAAVIEAIDAEIGLAVVITEGIPVQDSAYFWQYNLDKGSKTRIIGPNCPGLISPGASNAGIIPATIAPTPGRIGLVSKSGTLTYQMMYELRDFGFTTAVGIGGDPVIGTTHIDCLEAFQNDPETAAIVMIGEIGGDAEERAADYIKANVGIIPAEVFQPGSIGLVSRSGTLTYQIGHEVAQRGLGNSTIVGIGGDPVVGSGFIDVLEKFQADPETEYVVLVGEIGGDEEEKAATWVSEHMTKPVFSYIAGFSAPPGKTMGHAGAIISGSSGTAQAKKEALEAVGIKVGTTPTEVAELVAAAASA